MFNKVIYLIISMLFVGCAGITPVKEKDLTENYKSLIGKQVIIPNSVMTLATTDKFYKLKGKKVDLAKNSDFNSCKKAKVIEFFKQGSWMRALVQQDEKYFAVGGRGFRLEADQLYLKYPGKRRTVQIGKTKKSNHQRMCEGSYWTGMTETEFLFVMGEPDKINKTVMAGLVSKQYIYRGYSDSEYFYFRNGVLTSWQN